jgi:hypothetical protein
MHIHYNVCTVTIIIKGLRLGLWCLITNTNNDINMDSTATCSMNVPS